MKNVVKPAALDGRQWKVQIYDRNIMQWNRNCMIEIMERIKDNYGRYVGYKIKLEDKTICSVNNCDIKFDLKG